MIGWLRRLSARVPLRVTLVAALLLLVTVALGVTGAVGTYALRGYLIDRVDAQLADIADIMVDRRSESAAPGALAGLASTMSLYVQQTDPQGAGLWVLVSPSAAEARVVPRLPRLTMELVRQRDGRPFTTPPETGRGHQFRVLVTALPDQAGATTVAISLNEVDDTVGELASTYALIGAAVLAVLAALGYVMVQSSLRRLVEVERTAREIAAGDLARRVPPGHPDTEVGRLAAAFNAMLGEIESAFHAREASELDARASEARMRRFAADASHELRTPLTAIRGFAELYRQGGGDPAHVIGRIEHHAERMGSLVDDLLLLARIDQQRPLQRVPVDLLALAADAVQDAAATADHPVRLVTTGDGPPVVLGDEMRLRQVVGNLLSNALVHTPAGTPVTVHVGVLDGAAVLEVADAGPGLAPDDAARVFERFFRTDPARSRAAGGSGLGLSIVHALVSAHGGVVGLRTAPGQGARFDVRLPLYAPVAVPSAPVEEPAGS